MNNKKATENTVKIELVSASRTGVRVKLALNGTAQTDSPLTMYAKVSSTNQKDIVLDTQIRRSSHIMSMDRVGWTVSIQILQKPYYRQMLWAVLFLTVPSSIYGNVEIRRKNTDGYCGTSGSYSCRNYGYKNVEKER